MTEKPVEADGSMQGDAGQNKKGPDRSEVE
jgi:hypothetical protein